MNDSLGDRMKGYESTSKSNLLRRTPAIIRIDGKAFHTWTKGLKHVDSSLIYSPFSRIMHQCMVNTTNLLVANIQNAVLGYTQSDEISILLNDWKKFETEQWFNGGVQKIVSVAASMATAFFNREFSKIPNAQLWDKPAMFDARVYNIPEKEVANYFVWRQNDASRNSIQMLGHFYFSQKQMHGKNNSEVQDMLMLEKKTNWNDIDSWKKRGTCVVRDPESGTVLLDEEVPIFTKDRDYINKLLVAEEE